MQLNQFSTSPDYDATLLPYGLWQRRLSVSVQSDEKIEMCILSMASIRNDLPCICAISLTILKLYVLWQLSIK